MDDTTALNPEFHYQIRQDKLLFGALVDTLSQPLIPLISLATTSHALWVTLAKTYVLPSCSHIKHIKDQLKRITKGNDTVTDFMHSLKACADQLAALGKPVNARDTPISFEELHEKLINK